MIRPSSFPEFLTEPSGGWRGVIIMIGLGLAGNLAAAVVTLLVGTSPWLLGLLSLSILFILAALWTISRPKELVLVPEGEQPDQYPGLIVIVGTGRPGEDPLDQSAGEAIKYHQSNLKVCWLIATGGADGSLPVAQELKERCQTGDLDIRIRAVADPFSVQESYDLVGRIYAREVPEVRLREDQIVSDFTGGVKPMSAGMILACGGTRPMQYSYGRKAGIATVPRLVEFRPGRRQS